jgi:hypothetical protein
VRNVLVSSARLRTAIICTLSTRTASPLCSTTSFVRATRRMCNPLSSGRFDSSIRTTAELVLSIDLEGAALQRARLPSSKTGLLLRQRGGG